MMFNRRNLFSGLLLAPGTVLAGRSPRVWRMSEQAIVPSDFSLEAFVWGLQKWAELYPGARPPTVIRVADRQDEEIALRITRLEYREDLRHMRVVVKPFSRCGRLVFIQRRPDLTTRPHRCDYWCREGDWALCE